MAARDAPAGGGFVSYEKIVEAPSKWGLDEHDARRLERARWAVTEKIHGANFCFLVDASGVRCAKRKEVLGDGDDFFGHRRVLRRLEGRLRALFAAARTETPGLAALHVYGELFGGAYPHPEVAPVEGVRPVQTGVYYAPDVEFCAFDLAVVPAEGPRRYVDFDLALRQLDAADVFAAEPLFRGGYAEAMAFPERFESTVARRLGLPPLPPGNLAEGVVIKPCAPLSFVTPRGPVRPVLKKKIAEFAEDARFHGAVKWQRPRSAGVPALDRLEWEMLARLTPARVAAAISKVGPPRGPADVAKLAAELAADVWESLEASLGSELAGLSEDERLLLGAVLREAAARAAAAS